MAGPTVTLTFAGDTANLEKAFNKVGESADSMGKDVGKASDSVKRAGSSTDRFIDSADNADTKAMGFRDTITGLQDTFTGLTDDSLSLGERLLTLGMGVGDLASGFANFLIPVIAAFGKSLFTTAIPAVWAFTTALLANPITWVVVGIAALIAAIVLMIVHWDKVKKVFTTVVNWIGDRLAWVRNLVGNVARWIGQRFSDAWNWVRNKAAGVVDWFRSLPGRIGGFFRAIGEGIKNAFRSAFNFVASIWNNTVGRLSFTIPGWVPGIGGNSFGVPNIPTFHRGGKVPGAPGSEMLALLQAGETVTPAGRVDSSSGVSMTFRGNTDTAVATLIMQLIRSGQIQIRGA
ncbi:hypothetical protein B0I33_107322 [Prauserella shujinwangii]|uniref:Phage-related protein n=1 Tax=Prauserella shujinwangii TaxID=1453103 RepID=A0A2T0LSW9_9PSEU|nr:hypothetical protein [Prauserella shujinwangii]PRX46744.1 hypothetical protein B0I33_107322 [Prauserella shujinwangii]